MGSKRSLCGFIVEGISSILPKNGVVVDLMCGSGVLSGAFSRLWDTYSSDAQEFCKILSCVHSGGFDKASGQKVISQLSHHIKQNFDILRNKIPDWLSTEEDLFSRDIDETLLFDYQKFLATFPTLPNGKKAMTWNPQDEVSSRRNGFYQYPYCLFTTYFANVYFGLRQCAEIDSIRYAIDQLDDDKERTWAFGALIATLSALGSTYGGHFAQPGIDNKNITLSKLSSVISTRAFSINHEFVVRMLNLSEQSQLSSKSVTTVPGPWPNALASLDIKLKGKTVLVYVDPPYKREEYSRYYHVLETLVTYLYPSCTGKGLTPQPGERFRSEFFTKNESKINTTIISLIKNILQRGWMCGWSYSDSGIANISHVIKEVNRQTSCQVSSYAVPFQHKSQGGARPKKVTEYLILFSPT
jgi:adenine-specific DNA methylase